MVGRLVNLYLAEIAPDASLRPHKFISLAMILPDEARDSYDNVYIVVDMYIEVSLLTSALLSKGFNKFYCN